jgi:hypothetical protein
MRVLKRNALIKEKARRGRAFVTREIVAINSLDQFHLAASFAI